MSNGGGANVVNTKDNWDFQGHEQSLVCGLRLAETVNREYF
jgi:hypothetical protein